MSKSKIEKINGFADSIKSLIGEFEYIEVNIDQDGGYIEVDGVEVTFSSDGERTINIPL